MSPPATEITPAKRTELRALEAKATPGPWLTVQNRGGTVNVIGAPDDEGWLSKVCLVNGGNAANATLIAAARNALPSLLATIEDYANELMRLETEIGNLHYDRASLNVALTKAQAENERLRAALEPFAALSDAAANACCMVGDVGDGLIVGDFRRARAALKGGDADA